MKRSGGRRQAAAVALVMATAVLTAVLAACGGSDTTASSSPSAVSSSSAASSMSVTPLPTPTVSGTIAFEKVTKAGDDQGVAYVVASDIYVVNADGSGLTMLAKGAGRLSHPSWSPDGSRIVYAVYDEANASAKLWVMNADGSGARQLT